jgi:hypothetical protein
MNNSKITMAILSGLVAFALQGYGQTMYQVKIKGTCLTTNDSGAIVSQKLNNNSFIQDALTGTGSTNGSSSLTLVYVQNASTDPSVSGDFIEVVNSTNGAPVYTNLQFMYGGSFPPPLISPDQTQFVAGAQVIPLPLAGSGDSLGGATINERLLPKKTLINGTFNYTSLRSPSSTSNDIVKVCNGSFTVNKQFTPK